MVAVDVLTGKTGSPRAVNLDGLLYKVDGVMDVSKSHDCSNRYVCLIGNRQISLVREGESWWTE